MIALFFRFFAWIVWGGHYFERLPCGGFFIYKDDENWMFYPLETYSDGGAQ